MSRPRTRPLFLHTSSLSDAEYTVYVEALCDILEEPEAGGENAQLTDEELETRLVVLREARAWMRGRCRDVSVVDIDKILHLFKTHAQGVHITGGQYSAALRILMHLRNGSELNEGLAYVQAHPTLPQIDKPPPTSNPSTSSTIPQTYTFQPTTPIYQAHYAFPPYPTSLSAPETVASLSPASASTSFRTPPQLTLASTSSLPNSAPNPFGSFKAAPDHSASRAQDASAVDVSEKTKGKRVCSPARELRHKRRNTLKKTVRLLVRSSLREFTQNTALDMCYANYETGIVHKHGLELAGWPLPTFALDRISPQHLQAVVDGITDGSIRWVRLSDEQRAARVLAWRAKEDAALSVVSERKRKRVEGDEDGASHVTEGEEYRSAVRQMLEKHVESASASTTDTLA